MRIKNKALLIFCLLLVNSCKVYCQEKNIEIKSLEQASCKLKIISELGKDSLIIKYKNDSICIGEFTGIYKTDVWDDNFLYCEYNVRGGTGIGIRYCMIVCISNDVVYKSLSIKSYEYDIFDKTYDRYTDSLKLFNEHHRYTTHFIQYNNFKLQVAIHDENISKHDSNTNYNLLDTVVLKFDKQKKIFYNDLERLNGNYRIPVPPNYNKYDMLSLNDEKYPEIKILKYKYYFINNRWYERGSSDFLIIR